MTYIKPDNYSNNYNNFFLRKMEPKDGSLIEKRLPSDGNRVWQVIEQPLIEPITIDELKIFARIDGDIEDDLLFSFIQSVRYVTEEYIGRALIKQKIRMLLDFWPKDYIEFPKPPLISVEKVATLDEDDKETLYDSQNYYLIKEAIPSRLVLRRGSAPPINTERDMGGFLFEFYAGYGELASDVPTSIREAIKLWATEFYENRNIDPKNPPALAKSKLDLFKVSKVIFR